MLGTSAYPYPVAVVVPAPDVLAEFPGAADGSDAAAVSACEARLLADVQFWCRHHHLRHTPRGVALEANRWTPENGFLTPTLKKRRRPLLAHYEATREALFERVASGGGAGVTGGAAAGLSADLVGAIERCLPYIEGATVDGTATFAQLGADSLSVARMAGLLAGALLESGRRGGGWWGDVPSRVLPRIVCLRRDLLSFLHSIGSRRSCPSDPRSLRVSAGPHRRHAGGFQEWRGAADSAGAGDRVGCRVRPPGTHCLSHPRPGSVCHVVAG